MQNYKNQKKIKMKIFALYNKTNKTKKIIFIKTVLISQIVIKI